MKRLLLLLVFILSLPSTSLASGIGISRDRKPGNIPFDLSLGDLVANTIQIMVIIGVLGALVFTVWGAMDWILAGGDKEKLAAARKKIVNSLTGLVLLGLSAFIISLVGEVIGIDVFNLKNLPALNDNPEIRNFDPRNPNS